jgi:hypothetical protein
MNKIIQIVCGSTGDSSSMDNDLYCLTEDGKVYFWGRTRFEYKAGDKDVIHENSRFVDHEGNTHYFRYGWMELKDELSAS